MDDMTRKAKQWGRIMDGHRAAGAKHVAPEDNPLLYDPDFDEVVAREQADHEGKKQEAKVKAKRDQAERKAAEKAARKLDRGKP